MGVSIINPPVRGTPIYGNPQMDYSTACQLYNKTFPQTLKSFGLLPLQWRSSGQQDWSFHVFLIVSGKGTKGIQRVVKPSTEGHQEICKMQNQLYIFTRVTTLLMIPVPTPWWMTIRLLIGFPWHWVIILVLGDWAYHLTNRRESH